MYSQLINFNDYSHEIEELRNKVLVKDIKLQGLEVLDTLDSQSYHLGVFINKELIACSRLSYSGQIGRVVVDNNYRKIGIGTQMINKLISIAVQNNYKEVWLITYSPLNKFYEKRSFIIVDSFIEYSRPCYKMRKKF